LKRQQSGGILEIKTLYGKSNYMKKIKLTQGKYAIVDDEDYPVLSRLKWSKTQQNKRWDGQGFYIRAQFHSHKSGDSLTISMSDLLLPRKKGFVVVHKNKNNLDFRKNNLSYIPQGISTHFRQAYSTWGGKKKSSKYKGVRKLKFNPKSPNAKKVWVAEMRKDKERSFLKAFYTEKEAVEYYNKKAREIYGEFAYQNKIEEEKKCRVCGCTDNQACQGGCYWVEEYLCSQCYQKQNARCTCGCEGDMESHKIDVDNELGLKNDLKF